MGRVGAQFAAQFAVCRGVSLRSVPEGAVVGVQEVVQLAAERALLEDVEQELGLDSRFPLAPGERVQKGGVHLVEAEDERDARARSSLAGLEGRETGTQHAVGALFGQSFDVIVAPPWRMARGTQVGLGRRLRGGAGGCARGSTIAEEGDGVHTRDPTIVERPCAVEVDVGKGRVATRVGGHPREPPRRRRLGHGLEERNPLRMDGRCGEREIDALPGSAREDEHVHLVLAVVAGARAALKGAGARCGEALEQARRGLHRVATA